MTSTLRFSTTCLLLGGTLAFWHVSETRGDQPLARPLSSIDTEIGGWVSTEDPPLSSSIMRSLDATAVLSRTYRRGSHSMNLWVAFYANQRAGEVIHSPKYCLPGSGWEMIAHDAISLTAGGRRVKINDYLLMQPGSRQRMLYWYQGRRRIVASEYTGKLFLMWDALRYGQTSGAIVRIVLPEDPSYLNESLEFSQDVIRQMGRCFGDQAVAASS